MKKLISLLLVLSVVLGLAACGAKTETTPAATQAAASAAGEAAAPALDMSGETLVFSSDAVGSGSYNIIVEMAKYLENEGGFGMVDVQPTNPGGMGAPYLFADESVSLAS